MLQIWTVWIQNRFGHTTNTVTITTRDEAILRYLAIQINSALLGLDSWRLEATSASGLCSTPTLHKDIMSRSRMNWLFVSGILEAEAFVHLSA